MAAPLSTHDQVVYSTVNSNMNLFDFKWCYIKLTLLIAINMHKNYDYDVAVTSFIS